MTYLYLLKRFWRPITAMVAVIVCGLAVRWFFGVLDDRKRLQGEVVNLALVIEQYEENEVTVERLRSEIAVCAQSVLDLQQISDEWRDRYHHSERRNPRIIRVPVEVAAPGTPCDEAAPQLAAWLAAEVSE
jgi:hypothetical protein